MRVFHWFLVNFNTIVTSAWSVQVFHLKPFLQIASQNQTV